MQLFRSKTQSTAPVSHHPGYTFLEPKKWEWNEDYKNWTKKDVKNWLEELNEDWYRRDSIEDAVDRSSIDGTKFEQMQNASFIQDELSIDTMTASALAAVVKNRVKKYKEYWSSIRDLQSDAPIPDPSIPDPSICKPPRKPSISDDKSDVFVEEDEKIAEEEEKHGDENSNLLQLAVVDEIMPQIKCQSCNKSQSRLYQCQYDECKDTHTTGRIFCRKCFDFQHTDINDRNHTFDPNDKNIICINDMIDELREAYNKGSRNPNQIVAFNKSKKMQNLFAPVMAILTCGGAEGGTILGVGAEMTAATVGLAGDVLLTGLGYASFGAGVGAIIVCGFELGMLYYRRGELSSRELWKLAAKSISGNGIAFAGFMGCVGIGSLIGGPIGAGIGIVGGIIVGTVLKLGFNWWWNNYVDDEEKSENALRLEEQKDALAKFEFRTDNNCAIINDTQQFNKDIIRKRYHRKARECHPDKTASDTNKDWLELCCHYGILLALCEHRDRNLAKKSNKSLFDSKICDGGQDEEQKALLSFTSELTSY